MIDIKTFVKKINNKWEIVNPHSVTEDELNNLVIVTNTGRKFKLKEI